MSSLNFYRAILQAAEAAPSAHAVAARREYVGKLGAWLAQQRELAMHGHPAAEWQATQEAQEAASELMETEARAALHLTFAHSAGRVKIVNSRERLQQFAEQVLKSWSLWGGGPKPAALKPKAARSAWSAHAAKMTREMLEDGDAAGALAIADDKLAPLFFAIESAAYMYTMAQPVDAMDGFVSMQRDDGAWIVACPLSGLAIHQPICSKTMDRAHRTRAGAEQMARATAERVGAEQVAAALAKAQASAQDQDTARALWMAQHMIQIPTDLQARIDAATERATEAAAAEAVAQVVAAAQAGAAIELASDAAALDAVGASAADQAPELATADACAGADLATCEASSGSAPGASLTNGRATPGAARADTGAGHGQQISSKSGKWAARFRTLPDGAPVMEFSTAPNDWSIYIFETGRERMSALQAMARRADAQAGGDTPAPSGPARADTPTPAPSAGPDYTAPRETSNADYTAPRETSGEKNKDHLMALINRRADEQNRLEYAKTDAERELRAVYVAQITKEIEGEYAFLGMAPSVEIDDDALGAALEAPSDPARADTPTPAPGAGPDYTEARETSSADYTAPRETSTSQTGALSITITRGEGLIEECGKPATLTSFAEADALLTAWSETAPKSGGYDKCKFSITWPNGSTYGGRYDLKHHSAERPSLTAHMVDLAEFYIGKNCPAHMSAAAYAEEMERTSDGDRAAYSEILATMAALGAYFPKARPVALDLRAALAAGATPENFIGVGVLYCGDMHNAAGVGAIVEAEPCKWAGLRVFVVLEDGRELSATAAQFGDKAGDRYRLDLKRHGAPYMAQLAAAVASKKASESAAKEQAQQAHKKALQDLAAEYHYLQKAAPGGKLYGVTLAAANTRILLKREFPGVKFSVRTSKYSGGNSMDVSWTDGPTDAQVSPLVGRFSGGSFDGMTDCYEYSSSAFTELFGSAKYTFTHRELSDAAVTAIIAQEWPEEDGRPTLEDYRNGSRATYDEHGRDRVYLASQQWTPAGETAKH